MMRISAVVFRLHREESALQTSRLYTKYVTTKEERPCPLSTPSKLLA